MVNENKEEIVYGVPSNSDINRLIRSLIHHQQISENYVPAYDTIITKYINLAKIKNIKTIDTKDDEHYPCNENVLKQVICSLDRYE
jgi:Fe-S-cluster formation regulator IscX/YfhJ